MDQPSRSDICAAVADKLAAAHPTQIDALIGLDGFVDEIIHVVDKRSSATEFQRMETIAQFSRRTAEAAGQSANIELVRVQRKLGGNGPIMANAMASFGFKVTYLGGVGYPEIHPVFQPMAKISTVISIAEPCNTDALEFLDGKLMLGKLTAIADINWATIQARVGRDKLVAMIKSSRLVATVNWTMLTWMNEIWEHLIADIFPEIQMQGKLFFVDLADPEKRTVEDLLGALKLLEKLQRHVQVVLGLNLKEAQQVARALKLPAAPADDSAAVKLAVDIQSVLKLACVVVHPRTGAAAADGHGHGRFAGPFVKEPKISTGAGDHFNAGFVSGLLLGLNLTEALCMGTATSGYYVRNAASPGQGELSEFVRNLPPPQG